jgi:hypothetical protein
MSIMRRPPPTHDSANHLPHNVPEELRAAEMDFLLSRFDLSGGGGYYSERRWFVRMSDQTPSGRVVPVKSA